MLTSLVQAFYVYHPILYVFVKSLHFASMFYRLHEILWLFTTGMQCMATINSYLSTRGITLKQLVIFHKPCLSCLLVVRSASLHHKHYYYKNTTLCNVCCKYSFIRKRSKLQHYWMMGVYQKNRHKLTTLIGSKFEKNPRFFSVKNDCV